MSPSARFIDDIYGALRRLAPILGGREVGGAGALAREVRRSWVEGLNEMEEDATVIAVDGSYGHIDMSDGTALVFAQAEALIYDGNEARRVVKADAYLYPLTLVGDFESRFSEDVEHRVAIDALREAPEGGYLLLDGSIIARQINAAISFERHGVFAARYAMNLYKLIEEARRRDYRVAAVSKGSKTRVYTTALIDRAAREIEPLDMREGAIVSNLLGRRYMGAYKLLEEIKERGGAVSPELEGLVYEAMGRLTDVRLIASSGVMPPGRTEVLEVGPYVATAYKIMERLSGNPEAVKEQVLESGVTHLELSRGMISRAQAESLAVSGAGALFRLPPCALTYVWFRGDDDPLKVDAPLEGRWVDVGQELEFIEDPDFLPRILGILHYGYAGPRNHNVWLEVVDKEVKLTRKDLNVYESALERVLGAPVRHPRGYRRYWGGL